MAKAGSWESHTALAAEIEAVSTQPGSWLSRVAAAVREMGDRVDAAEAVICYLKALAQGLPHPKAFESPIAEEAAQAVVGLLAERDDLKERVCSLVKMWAELREPAAERDRLRALLAKCARCGGDRERIEGDTWRCDRCGNRQTDLPCVDAEEYERMRVERDRLRATADAFRRYVQGHVGYDKGVAARLLEEHP